MNFVQKFGALVGLGSYITNKKKAKFLILQNSAKYVKDNI